MTGLNANFPILRWLRCYRIKSRLIGANSNQAGSQRTREFPFVSSLLTEKVIQFSKPKRATKDLVTLCYLGIRELQQVSVSKKGTWRKIIFAIHICCCYTGLQENRLKKRFLQYLDRWHITAPAGRGRGAMLLLGDQPKRLWQERGGWATGMLLEVRRPCGSVRHGQGSLPT